MPETQAAEDQTERSSRSNDLERRREIGQFFTPEIVATFIWDMLEIIQGAGFPKQTRVVDPACGEGVFLRVAATRGKIDPDSLFGADIDATLPPLWQRDPALQRAHLHLANGLLDDPDKGLRAGTFDVVVGNPPFAGIGVRDLLRLLEESGDAIAVPETDLFGEMLVKEPPEPYGLPLTAQERLALNQLAVELGRYTCWRLSREQNGEAPANNAATTDELFANANPSTEKKNGNGDFQRAAEMLRHWPKHRLLDPKRADTKFIVKRLASTAIEVFFMERFLRLAKPGGLIAVIVPDGIAGSDQLGPLRTWLMTELDLLAVVSLPQKVFTGVGANAKTSVVFARRLLTPRPGFGPADDPNDDEKDLAKVLMCAPNTRSPAYSLEHYLQGVCQGAKEDRSVFSTGRT